MSIYTVTFSHNDEIVWLAGEMESRNKTARVCPLSVAREKPEHICTWSVFN